MFTSIRRSFSIFVRFSVVLLLALTPLLVLPPAPVSALSYGADINKEFTPATIPAGGISRLTINIYNPNSFPLENASFTDSLVGVQPGLRIATPANLSNGCGGTAIAAAGTTTISLSGGSVPAQSVSGPGSCSVSMDITSTTPGTLTNTIPAYGILPAYGGVGLHATGRGGLDIITNATPASANLLVTTVQPPSMNKNFTPNTVWVGQSSQLEINITNNDLVHSLTQATFTDTLPAPFVVAAPLTTSLSGCGAGSLSAAVGAASITLNNATIAPNSTCRVRVRVISSTQGEYTNTIQAGPGGPGSLQTQQGVTNTLPVEADINVQAVGIVKAFSPSTFAQGDTSTLTITLRNPTGADYVGVGLVDDWALTAPGLTISGTPAASQCGGTITSTPTSLTLTGGVIPAGNVTTPGFCTIVAQVTSSTAGTKTNTIPAYTMTGPITNAFPATATATVLERTIGVVKAFGGNFVAGGTTSLTITLRNQTSTAFTGVAFTDTMPTGLTIVGTPTASASCGGGADLSSSTANAIVLSNGIIPPGTVAVPGTCVISATVTASVGGPYSNTIDGVTSAQGIGNNSPSTANVTVYPIGANATVAKAFQTSRIVAGAPTRLRITITAPNDTPLNNIYIRDTLPDDMVIVGMPLAPANPTTSCGGSLTAGISTNLIQLTGGVIPSAGGSCTITVYVTSNIPGPHVNTIPGGTLATFEGRTDPNDRSATLDVTSFTISKSFAPANIAPNGRSRLTISLRNTNLQPLINVSLTDLLSSMGGNGSTNGVFVASPDPNPSTTCGGAFNPAAGSQTIALSGGTIPASDGVVPGLCTLSVDVEGRGDTTTRTNTIDRTEVSGQFVVAGPIVRPAANATADLTILDLSIGVAKEFNPILVFGGTSSEMRITLVNPNTVPLSGINFTDTMPANMILANPLNASVGTCGGTLTPTGTGSFNFSGGSLPASGSCVLSLNATMTVIGNLTNTIGAGDVKTFEGATNPDPAPATLTNQGWASVTKSFGPNPVPVGQNSLLTITITNSFESTDLTGMGLNDALPALPVGLELQASPVAVNTCGGDLNLDFINQIIKLENGELARGSSCSIVVPVKSDSPNTYVNTIPADSLITAEKQTNLLPATDALVVTSFSLGNRVWNDNGAGGGGANNGLRDGAEPGLDGVTVNLYRDDGSGTVIATTTTAGGGYYRFDGLAAGDYIVEVVTPAGYLSSTVNAGDPDTDVDDNDDNGVFLSGSNIRSHPVTLGPGANEPTNDNDPSTNPEAGESVNDQSNRTVDFGFYQPYSLGNRVWHDNGGTTGVANNGLLDGDEPGIANVIVNIYRDTNDDGTPEGVALAYTVTDANGYYRFDNLVAGTYIVEVVTPAGYTSSIVDAGDPDSDADDNDDNGVVPAGSNIRSHPVTLGPGSSEPTGETDPATNPLPGEAPDAQSNRTVDFGFTAAYSLGNRVWFDNGAGAGGVPNDGLRNGTEPGIDGVTVNLYRAGSLIATTTTTGGGYYRFDGLAAGDYSVEIVVPAGYSNTAIPATGSVPNNDVDNDNNGVNLSGSNLSSNLVTLGGASEPTTDNDPATNPLTGEALNNFSNRTVDFGLYYESYSLGNRVWNDNGAGLGGAANDGLRNGDEPGLGGVTVRLYRDTDGDGNPDGAAIALTATDASGYYRFDYLQAGDYIVEVVTPAGYTLSDVRFADPNTDVDDDNNGLAPGSNVRSGKVTLGGASEPETDNDPLTNPLTGEALNNYSNRTVDFGFAPLASLGNFVWNDLNQNGIQDAGEPGIPGVTVDLYTGAGVFVQTTTTGGGGIYNFTGLIPGSYYVDFTPPAGLWTISPINQGGDDALDSDADTSTGQTIPTTLEPGENDLTWDAGLYQIPASLGDFVWNDLNRDGIQDAGETGIDGVRVDLYRPGYGPDGIPFTADDALVVATTTTSTVGGVAGTYNFTGLVPGDYYVDFTPPAGYAISPINQGGDDTLDSDADPVTGQTIPTTLISGENDPTWDAGLYQLASLGNFVWDDLNRDGIQDAGETGINGVTVELYTGAGVLVAATTTTTVGGVAGTYNFTNLVPGDYYVVFIPPAGYAISPIDIGSGPTPDANDSDADTSTGRTATTTLDAGENDLTWDAGLYQLASLGDRVWEDLNRDGIQDAGEPGIVGVTVDLYTAAGALVTTTTTGAGGIYNFTDLIPGDYYVDFTLPAGYTFSPRDIGSGATPDANDSDADASTGQTIPTTLIPGENDLTWDAGMYLIPASLGNFVWLDANGNGIQDAGETGINGVTVELYTGAGALVATTTTANVAGVDGTYGFTNLTPGYYYVVFTPPPGYSITLLNQGADAALDSDAIVPTGQTVVTLLDPGENDLTWDAGLTQPASLGNFVWNDVDADGIQDAGETGIPNVTVTLYRTGFGLIATTTTDSDGFYSFTDLIPGEYYLVFTRPADYASSPQDQGGSDALDSDADTSTGQTTPTTLVAGENDTTWDAGYYQLVAIGNRLWFDTGAGGGTADDGIQNGAEAGVENARVELYRTGDTPGTDPWVAWTTTDSNGNYVFDDLLAGSYFLFIPATQFNTDGALDGYFSSTDRAGFGGDDGNNQDVDENGIDSLTPWTTGIRSNDFDLQPGFEPTGDEYASYTGVWKDNNVNFTADFGFQYIPQVDLTADKTDGVDFYVPGLTLTYTIVVGNAGPNTAVDAVITDNRPADIESWTWISCTPSGGATGCDVTGVSTTADFTDYVTLPKGASIEYTVTAVVSSTATIDDLTNLVRIDPAADTVERDDTNNSDDDIDQRSTIAVTKDDHVTIVAPGALLTYDLIIENTGFQNLTSIRVIDTLPDDVTFQNVGVGDPAPAIGSSAGHTTLTWTGISLAAGANTTITVIVRVNDVPAGASITNTVEVLDLNSGASDSALDTDNVAISNEKALTFASQHGPIALPPPDPQAEAYIGETLTYRIQVTLPPGTVTNLTAADVLDPGLAFDECTSPTTDPVGTGVTIPADLVVTLPPGVTSACPAPSGDSRVTNDGHNVEFTFGTVENITGEDRTIVVEYLVVVLDIPENVDGVTGLNNAVTWSWDGISRLPASAVPVEIVEPDLSIVKTANPTTAVYGTPINFTLEVAHTAESTAHAYDVVLRDTLPTGLTFVAGSVVPTGLTPTSYRYDIPTRTLEFIWDEFPLGETVSIAFQAIFVGPSPVLNESSVEWSSLPIDPALPGGPPTQQSAYNLYSTERWYDPNATAPNNYRAAASVTIQVPGRGRGGAGSQGILPATGFAPDVVTSLPAQPAAKAYTRLGGMWLEIPRLGLSMPITGVPIVEGEWDLTWLSSQAGYLEGTTYPGQVGTSGITGHVTLADGAPGPFRYLEKLIWGDQVILHANGQRYIYEMRELRKVIPSDFSIFKNDGYTWMTLVTCKDFAPLAQTYSYRTAVRAVLTRIEPDAPAAITTPPERER
jgi:LPXTG-site transpeptidase (sortase) family protein